MNKINLKRLLQICHRNSILSLKKSGKILNLHYGPLGSLLKRNIFNEWLNSLINNNEVYVLPFETAPKNLQLDISENKRKHELLDPVNNCLEENLYCPGTPFGFAIYGPCINNVALNRNPNWDNLSILRYLQAWTDMSVIFLIPQVKKMNWFYFWSKQRYLWWRKFSSVPSKFSMSEMTSSPSISHQLSILHEFPWGKECLETITLHKDEFTAENCKEADSKYNFLNCQSVISCETTLDLAVITYLSNSYTEEWREKNLKNVLHLHYKLAPYKVSLHFKTEDVETYKKLKNIANHLRMELMKSNITILNTQQEFTAGAKDTFDWYDEMGLLYTIVLTESSLETGIAGLRSRDTTLQEQVHIAELTSKLTKYLKV